MGNMDFFIPGTVFGTPLWKVAARLQIEALALSCRRAQAYAELSNSLAACRAPDDLLREQVRFWQIAQRQYIASLDNVFAPAPLAPEVKSEPAEKTPLVRDYMVVPEQSAALKEQAQTPTKSNAKHQYINTVELELTSQTARARATRGAK